MMMSFWVFTTALGYHFWSLVMEVSSQHKLYRCLVFFLSLMGYGYLKLNTGKMHVFTNTQTLRLMIYQKNNA